MGACVAKELNIPHIVHIREFGNENTIWGPANIKWINKNSIAIITISKALKKFLVNFVNEGKYYVSYDGVSYTHKRVIIEKKDDFVNILLTGRIAPAKAQDEAIKALKNIKT